MYPLPGLNEGDSGVEESGVQPTGGRWTGTAMVPPTARSDVHDATTGLGSSAGSPSREARTLTVLTLSWQTRTRSTGLPSRSTVTAAIPMISVVGAMPHPDISAATSVSGA